MVTLAKGGLPLVLFNLGKVLNHRVTVFGITALLAVFVLWQAGSLVWKLWLLSDESPQAATVVPSSTARTEPQSFQDLLRFPLMQSRPNSGAEGPVSGEQPRTSLNLKLVGLMYSADLDEARAIIESPEDGARSYSTHEKVADKVEIDSIEPDRVILLHAGQREALMLYPEEESSGARSTAVDDAVENQVSAGPQSAAGQSSAGSPRKIADLMRDFSATPVEEDGKLIGFRLAALRDPELMKTWGIEAEDVITAVNEIPLNSQGRIMVLYDKLKKQKEFELTVRNGGDTRTIIVDFDE